MKRSSTKEVADVKVRILSPKGAKTAKTQMTSQNFKIEFNAFNKSILKKKVDSQVGGRVNTYDDNSTAENSNSGDMSGQF